MARRSRPQPYYRYPNYIWAVRCGLVGLCVGQAKWNCTYDVNMHDINKIKPTTNYTMQQEQGASFFQG